MVSFKIRDISELEIHFNNGLTAFIEGLSDSKWKFGTNYFEYANLRIEYNANIREMNVKINHRRIVVDDKADCIKIMKYLSRYTSSKSNVAQRADEKNISAHDSTAEIMNPPKK